MGRWDCQRGRGKREVLSLRQNRELSFWERGVCRWRVAKDGGRVVSNGRERGNKTLRIPFADNANPPRYCFYVRA